MIIVAGQLPPVGPPVTPPVGLGVVLVGQDGSSWDLANGLVKLGPGVSGLGSPDPERWWRDSPSLDGSTHLGYRIPRAELTLPVHIGESSSLGWRTTQAAFMRAIDPAGTCSLIVTTPDGLLRTLTVRLTGGASPAYPIDPLLIRHAGYTLEFAAADPFWRTTPLVSTFTGAQLNPPSSTWNLVVNPGDVPAWPKWTITGPYTSATVGVYATATPSGSSIGSFITLATPIAAGSQRIVDTDPRADTIAVLDANGVDRWTEVTSRKFAPVPVGAAVAVFLDFLGDSGATSVNLQFTPAYRQAW